MTEGKKERPLLEKLRKTKEGLQRDGKTSRSWCRWQAEERTSQQSHGTRILEFGELCQFSMIGALNRLRGTVGIRIPSNTYIHIFTL